MLERLRDGVGRKLLEKRNSEMWQWHCSSRRGTTIHCFPTQRQQVQFRITTYLNPLNSDIHVKKINLSSWPKLHSELVLRLFFTPFCYNAPCQSTPLLKLRSHISGFNVLWLTAPYYAKSYLFHCSYGNIIFELRPFHLHPIFLRTQLGRKIRIWCSGRGKTHTGVLWEDLQKTAHREDRGIDGRIPLEWTLNRVGRPKRIGVWHVWVR